VTLKSAVKDHISEMRTKERKCASKSKNMCVRFTEQITPSVERCVYDLTDQ
jgi:hypothetical protein